MEEKVVAVLSIRAQGLIPPAWGLQVSHSYMVYGDVSGKGSNRRSTTVMQRTQESLCPVKGQCKNQAVWIKAVPQALLHLLLVCKAAGMGR